MIPISEKKKIRDRSSGVLPFIVRLKLLMDKEPGPKEGPKSEDITETPSSDDVCVVCCEPLIYVSIGSCNHPLVCSLCSLKLRILEKDSHCIYCKTPQERVFFSSNKYRKYESFQTYGDIAGPDLIYDDDGEAFFDKAGNGIQHHEKMLALRELRCGIPDCEGNNSPFASKPKLDEHLLKNHKLHLCKLCWEFRRLFPMEQIRYTSTQLQVHIEKGDKKEGMRGHPMCKFCKKRYYNDDLLYKHLNKDHETCHICRRQGKGN